MKKINIVICLIVSLLLLTSCGNIPAGSTMETTVGEASSSEATTTMMDPTTSEIIETIETTAAESTVETTNKENITTVETHDTEEIVLETLPDMFVELMAHTQGRGFYYPKSDITRFSTEFPSDYVGVHYRVIGYDESYQTKLVSKWYVEIIDVYGEERFHNADSIDYNKIHTVAMRGVPTSSIYGIPVPTIGEDYFRYVHWNELLDRDWWVALYMDIEEIDGEKYLYGYGIDMSAFDGAIEITDEEENQIYNEENHYNIIAYLKSIGKELPTFDYKVKMEDFLHELGILMKN